MKKYLKIIVWGVAIFIVAGCSNQKDSVSKEKVEDTTLYLVRHGKTMFNTTGQVQGWSDTPLTDEGQKVAELLGKGLREEQIQFDHAYSSDLGRAISTANIILKTSDNQKIELNTLSGLREWGYGGYEGRNNADMWTPIFEQYGLTFDEEWSQYPKLMEKMDDEAIANEIAKNDETGTAESYQEIVTRSKKAMDQVIKEASETGGNVLIVSHGSEIPTILEILAPGSYKGEDIGNCSVTKIVYKEGVYTGESIGDTHFLENGNNKD
ncbi:histidine phosphatase family protein [Candidatus Enterococcus willemsii]|uniref:phosphoglycerate mutase (2,3-diphosphoglycerate-dependent) n=1 Tax=Candidatus Enterococcus willemsii TaxID=1857215 RepID=A0ABQ6YYI2_9ENTE|nr:histidine phosphatase family protein [Enterococcus sp. CU12B]KAF1302705.1 phosphoglycerate mutase [Enterococcus sp. CU12B]